MESSVIYLMGKDNWQLESLSIIKLIISSRKVSYEPLLADRDRRKHPTHKICWCTHGLHGPTTAL